MEFSTPILWLIAGVILCTLEFLLPTAFIEFTLGVSALIVAAAAIVVPHFGAQVALWLLLSVVLTLLSRRLVPSSRAAKTLEDSKEAVTLTEIPAGQPGRVIYEGNSWQARCEDHDVAIAPNQPVYVVGRRGNMLLVIPESSIRLPS